MTRCSVISDLHLEFGDLELPGGDVLILSGDVCESRTLRKYRYDPNNIMDGHGTPKRLDRAQRFFIEECAKYRKVFYVMGNHEHYHSKFYKTYHELVAEVPDNVQVLERECVTLDGVLFLGATMWTDCNKGDPLTLHALKDMMMDYKAITYRDDVHHVYRKLDPRDTVQEHRKTLDYFKQILSENRQSGRNLPVVVMTHHSPSFLSTHPRYQNETLMNGGYSSDLSEFILDHPEIKVWTHGHMHDPFDYKIGDTRVICNPRGYRGYETQANTFDPTIGFDI